VCNAAPHFDLQQKGSRLTGDQRIRASWRLNLVTDWQTDQLGVTPGSRSQDAERHAAPSLPAEKGPSHFYGAAASPQKFFMRTRDVRSCNVSTSLAREMCSVRDPLRGSAAPILISCSVLGGNEHFPKFFKDAPKLWLWG
jgi:hypothetical protein